MRDLLSECLAGKRCAQSAETEAAYHDAWHAINAGAITDTLVQAAAAGMAADRLAWVFAAGYQASVRCAFPHCPASGWAAFLVSEDRGDDPLPGVVEKNGTLFGWKTWVAGSDHARHLYLTADQGDGIYYYVDMNAYVDTKASAVTMQRNEDASFLSTLTQGRAGFDGVPAARVDGQRVKQFMAYETIHVAAALTGCLLSHGVAGSLMPAFGSLAVSILSGLDALGTEDLNDDLSKLTMAGLDLQLAQLVRAFEAEGALLPGWDADRKLTSLYSRGVQSRARRVLGHHTSAGTV